MYGFGVPGMSPPTGVIGFVDTTSSIRSISPAISVADSTIAFLEFCESRILSAFISDTSLFITFTPIFVDSFCFAKSFVKTSIVSIPAFLAKATGNCSNASAYALITNCSLSVNLFAYFLKALDAAISAAPPPGSALSSCLVFITAPIASLIACSS